MNAANKLTMIRIAIIPFFLFFAMPAPKWWGENTVNFLVLYGNIIALVLFIIASFTDLLDGYVARKHNLITSTGKFLDPLADKLLISAAMIALVAAGRLSGWIFFVILTREFAVTGIRTIAASEGYVIAANKWGKIKTVIQIIAVCISYFPISYITGLAVYGWVAALIITVISGYIYVKEFFNHAV